MAPNSVAPPSFINRYHFFVHIRTSADYGVALTAFLASCRNFQAHSRHNPSRFEPILCNFDLVCACLLVECVRANCGAAKKKPAGVDCGSGRWFHIWLLRRSGRIISVGSLPDGYPSFKPSLLPVVAAVWEVPSTEP